MSDYCNSTSKDQQKCEYQILASVDDIFKDIKSYDDNNCYTTATKSESVGTRCKVIEDGWKTKIQNLNRYIEFYKSNFSNSLKTDLDKNPIISKYQELIAKREKLDAKLYELYSNDYETLYSIKPQLDTTVVTGIVWTVVASAMIYYIIVKI